MKVLEWSPSLKAREWIWRPWEEEEREEQDLRAETNASSQSEWFWCCLAWKKMRMKCCGSCTSGGGALVQTHLRVGFGGSNNERRKGRERGEILSLRLAEMNTNMRRYHQSQNWIILYPSSLFSLIYRSVGF